MFIFHPRYLPNIYANINNGLLNDQKQSNNNGEIIDGKLHFLWSEMN